MDKNLTITVTPEDISDRFSPSASRCWMFEPAIKEYWGFNAEIPKWYIEAVLKDFLVGYFWLQAEYISLEDFISKMIGAYDFKLSPKTNTYETAQISKIREKPNWTKERIKETLSYLKKGL